jgi:hypothetical protein
MLLHPLPSDTHDLRPLFIGIARPGDRERATSLEHPATFSDLKERPAPAEFVSVCWTKCAMRCGSRAAAAQ